MRSAQLQCGRSPISTVIDSSGNGVARLTLRDALTYCGPDHWDALVRCSRLPSPFMRWAWHHAWVASAPPDDVNASFALAFPGPEQGVQGLLPLSIRSLRFRHARVRALTWATGSVGCPDHLDFPAAENAELHAAIPLLEALPWDVVVLSGAAEEATNITRLLDAFVQQGYSTRRTVLDSCPFLDLPRSWDDYLASLSGARRQSIRRKERILERDHAMTVTDYAPDRLDEGFRRLRSLHEERWAGGGALGVRQLALLRAFSSDLAPHGELWLTTLDLNGEPAAAWYGFTWLDTAYFYQGGRDPRWASHSVGAVLLGAMIRRAIERGYRRFDFLRGRDRYKLEWTSTERLIYEIVVFRPDWRGRWLRTLDFAARTRARMRSLPEFATSDS